MAGRGGDEGESGRAVAVGLLIGLISFFAFFGIERALGTGEAYRWPAGDLAQHVAGAFAYIDGDWNFPLFHTERINAPDGVNIIFTDSAPFAGLIAKILHTLTGLRFNYLGAWFAIAWIGQATAGAYLIGQLGRERCAAKAEPAGAHPRQARESDGAETGGKTLKQMIFYACGAIFALAWPAFLNRHFHLALGSHFLVLFALGLYFATARGPLSLWRGMIWALLLGVAIWTHAYLFVMSAAIFCAALVDGLWRRRIEWPRAILAFVSIIGFCLGLAFLGGYQSAGSTNAQGYGAFRLDLLAYVWPHGSAIVRAPLIYEMQSAFEGFNYLGLGGLAAVVLAAALVRPRHFTTLCRHPALLAVVLGMLAFAITNSVSFAGHILFQLPAPVEKFPFSTFRASGRFGWPLGYLVVFASLVFLIWRLSEKSRPAALLLLAALTGLQWADATMMLSGMQVGWRAEPKPIAQAAMAGAGKVHFAPPIDCLAAGPLHKAGIEMLAVAAAAGVIADSAHTARTAPPDCAPEPAATGKDVVVVTVPDTAPGRFYDANMACRAEAGLLVCTPPA